MEGRPDLYPLLDLSCRAKASPLAWLFVDGTNIRADQKMADAAKRGAGVERDDCNAIGRSRGGYGTKACVITGRQGRPVDFRVAPGQAHEFPHALSLLDQLPGVPRSVVADRSYSSTACARQSGPPE